MKKIFFFLILFLPLKNYASEFFKGTYVEALEKCRKEDKLLFLDFTAIWCGPCHAMEQEVLNEPEVAKYITAKFVILKMDIDEPSVYYYREKFVSSGIPDYTFLDANGELVAKRHGSCTKAELMNFFRSMEVRKVLSNEEIENKLNQLKIAYEKSNTVPDLSRYIDFLLKYKNADSSALQVYKAAITKNGKKNNLISVPRLLAKYYGAHPENDHFKDLIDFLISLGMEDEIKISQALTNYDYYIGKGNISKARSQLDICLQIIVAQNWTNVATRINLIKQFAYTYNQYEWGISTLELLKQNYDKAYHNKSRLPLSGHYYQLAMMNYLNNNCGKVKENLSFYEKHKGGYSHVSAYSVEDS